MESTALAGTEIILNPYDVGMESDDTVYVDACIYKNDVEGSTPIVGMPLVITDYCFDGNDDADCFDAVDTDTNVFKATVVTTPTNENGCGVIMLETENAMGGSFAYVVNGMEGDNVKVQETGTAFIPEFTVLGAGAFLAVAGVYAARKRKN